MLFNSYFFIYVFLPVVLIVFFRFNNHLSKYWLIAASVFFYAYGNISYVCLFICSIVFNYSFSCLLLFIKRHNRSPFIRQLTLVCGISSNLLVLGYFKYTNFIINNINYAFHTMYQCQSIVLPLAISFYTFQQIAYLIDMSKAPDRPQSFNQYCLFVSFFPQLIAGPIVRYHDTFHQFSKEQFTMFNSFNVSVGMTLFIIGLFKKVVLADSIGIYTTQIFEAAKTAKTIFFIESWCAALGYSFQLYFDFSGYSDMAIGLGRMFNIILPLNFYSPYRSLCMIDFWKRWHISLSLFFRDYLYIPMGGNRKGLFRKNVHLMITMLFVGLWHGAGWTFVIWGGLHGLYLIINHVWRFISNHYITSKWFKITSFNRFLSFTTTFCAIITAWVIFRSDTIAVAQKILSGMFAFNGMNLSPGFLFNLSMNYVSKMSIFLQSAVPHTNKMIFFWIALLSFIIWLCPNTYEFLRQYHPSLHIESIDIKNQRLQWQPTFFWAFILSTMLLICIMLISSPTEFLYFNF
jgi:D-alanyl-lipoteichoic acid acyltransferase DltB (MBOAT superfamily)